MWIAYAIIASVLWGVDYTLTEHTLRNIGTPTLLTVELFVAFVAMVVLGLKSGSFLHDWGTLQASPKVAISVLGLAVVFTIANLLIVLSIGSRNATLSGLIEISYPLFIVFFSWLFFRENNLNAGVAIGGACVALGVMLIYVFN